MKSRVILGTMISVFVLYFVCSSLFGASAQSVDPPKKNETYLYTTKYWLGSTHGILMTVAWLFLTPVAILFSRYLRHFWPEKRIAGMHVWFVVHRTCNYLACLLTLISMAIILFAMDFRWTGPAPWQPPEKMWTAGAWHTLFGTIAVVLALSQPVYAYIRPAPDANERPKFNSRHRLIGLVSIGAGFITMYIVAYKFGKRFEHPNAIFTVFNLFAVICALGIIGLENSKRRQESGNNGGDYTEMVGNGTYRPRDEEKQRNKYDHYTTLLWKGIAGLCGIVTMVMVGNMLMRIRL